MKKKGFMKLVALAVVGTMVAIPASALAGNKKPTQIDKISATTKSVYVGKEFELKVYSSERNIDDDYFVWSTSNSKVVRLDDDDNRDDEMEFKAVNPGTATITCKIKGTNIKKICKVTVKEKQAYIDVDDDGYGYIEVEVGEHEDLDAKLRYANTSNKTLVYQSLTPSIISVNKYGKVYGKKIGTGKVQITSKADSSIKTVVEIRVVWDD